MATSDRPRPGRRMRTIGVVLMTAGVLALVAAGVLGYLGVSSMATVVATGKTGVEISGNGQLHLTEGEDQQLYRRLAAPVPRCSVTNPSGQPAPPGVTQSSSLTRGPQRWESFGSFRADEEGAYEIDCGDSEILIAPPVSIAGIFMGAGGILGAVFVGVAGAGLLITGLILFFVGRSRLRRSDPGQVRITYPD